MSAKTDSEFFKADILAFAKSCFSVRTLTSVQKTALSVLIAVVLFGGISVLAFTELFSVIDARFYEPAKISAIRQKLESVSDCYEEYAKTLDARFSSGEDAFLKKESAKTFAESTPSASDVKARTALVGDLRSSTQGLLGIRVIDKNSSSIHFSTFRSDILREVPEQNLVAYKNYGDVTNERGGEEIEAAQITLQESEGEEAVAPLVYFDGKEQRILFSYPFYDRYRVFRGTIVFYVNAQDFGRMLLARNLLGVGTSFDFLASQSSHGYAIGIPPVAKMDFSEAILKAWSKNSDSNSAQKLFEVKDKNSKTQNYWIMITSLAESDTFVSEVFSDEILSLPFSGRILILICIFASIFLTAFLILNLRRDDETVIRERILNLQIGVVDEYLKRKIDLNYKTISGKRAAVTKEIIESLGRRGRLRKKEIEELIDRSWDELLAAMNIKPQAQQGGAFSPESAEEIKTMLQEILSNANIKVGAPSAEQVPQSAQPLQNASSQSYQTQAQPASEQDAEELDEIEVLEEAEMIEDLEETAVDDEVERVEEAENSYDAEEIEELENLEEAEEAPSASETEMISFESSSQNPPPLANGAENFEEVEELEEIEEAESAEEEISLSEFEDASSMFDIPLTAEPAPKKPFHPPEEMVDISEDVSNDFFALKEDDTGLLNKAVKVRNIFADYKEDDFDFFASTPLFEGKFDDEDEFGIGDEQKHSLLAKATKIAEAELAKKKAKAAIPLSDMEMFVFDDIQNSGVIAQDRDGVFSIKPDIKTDGVEQDSSFKLLVDSVLNN